jgi:nitroreductase
MTSCGTEPCNGSVHLELARAAIKAPSPDNNQPWRFVSVGDRLEIYLDPRRALPSDVNSMFDLLGIGAAIENVVIAGRQLGFRSEVDYAGSRRDADGRLLAATMRFRIGSDPDPLHEQLASRCTNRRLYSTQSIERAVIERIAEEAREFPDAQLDWVADRRGICAFAPLIATSDRFRFEYEPFHRELYRQLRFTVKEAETTRDGLDVRTLELPPGAAAVVHWLRRWPRMKVINRLGLGRLLTFPSWVSVRKSGALGILSLPDASAERFLRGGRAFQRIWLTAQSEGLALQPLGSLPIFIAQMEQLDGRNLHAGHQRLAKRLAGWLRQLVPATDGRTLLMIFRVGYAKPPQVRSLRRPGEDVFEQLGNG